MKTLYIKDLQKSQVFEAETFAIFDTKRAEDKTGKPYYDLVIGDKTGRLNAKIWADKFTSVDTKSISQGKIVLLDGKVDEYRGNLQITIYSLQGVDETRLDDYIESSMFDSEEMFKEVLDEVGSIQDAAIKKVLLSILADEDIVRRFKYWPAATVVHHEFRSGLIQHILEMITVSKGLERFYPDVDFDILTAGIILHDIGKLYELDGFDLSTPYTREGQLLGHIYLGARLFEKFAKDILEETTYLHILHLILSHHGKTEYGSPVVPATTEALMLTYIDNVSAKPRTADSVMKQMNNEEEFSNRIFWLENAKIWKPRKISTGGNITKSDDSTSSQSEEDDRLNLI